MKIHNLLKIFILTFFIIKCSKSTDIQQLECQFTDGLCNWLNQDEKWKLGDYTNVTFGRPVRPTSKGGYVYVDDEPNLNGYQILSPILDQDVKQFCLSFNYYMFGPDVGQLTLRLIDDNGSGNQWVEVDNDVWNRKGSQDDDWSIGRYHFTLKRKTQVRLAFVATSSNIALGPIKVNPGSCDYSNLCNFEDISVCFWLIEPDYSSNYAWFISDGKSSEGSFISKDTSTQSESGKFLRTPNDGAIDSKSLFTTKTVLNSDEARCMSFNFFKPNKDSDLVEINLVNNQSTSKYIWTSASIKPNLNWQPVRISLLEDGDFNIFISAHKHSKGNNTSVAIDDIQINPESCKNLIDCSFDGTNCALSITSGPLLIGFGRLSNAESLNYTMDSFKDNDLNDFFIYTDIPISNQSITYSFSTPAVPSTDLACLSFLYFMEPIDSFANYFFEINVQSSSGYNLLKYEPQVTFAKWTSAEFVLSTIELYQIEFSLTTESRLFAAFDDIKLVEGQCGAQHSDEHPSPKIYKNDSFNDLSNWSNYYWTVKIYNSLETGLPTADPFGERGGKYLTLTNTGTLLTGILHSAYYESGFYCISIWYWCNSDYGRLFIASTSGMDQSVPILNELCDKQRNWKLLEATFTMKEKFQLQIIGEVKMGDIALDEMTVFNGPCYRNQVLDETCTFDDGTDCGIDVVASPYYNWRIEPGSQLSTPMVDKSTATLNGKALTLDLSPVPQIDSTSYFFLANLVKEDSYCISFSYYIRGDCHLDIWKTERDNIKDLSNPLVTYDNKFDSTWTKVIFQIDGVTKESDIVFGGTYSSGSTGLLAVDDLTVSLGECVASFLCDFDSTCNWDNLPIGTTIPVDGLGISYKVTTLWKINPASSAKSLGYPRKDHTYGSSGPIWMDHGHDGNYGYTLTNNEKAILASPVIYLDGSETICLKLAYVAESPGSIEVLVEQRENKAYIFKNLQSEDLRTWKYSEITIPLRKSQTRMAKVYIISSSKGKSAVDDVRITRGSCPDAIEVFECSDGTKLPVTSRCDYVKDCKRGEDEQNCGSCEFNGDACYFTSSGQASWGIKTSYIALDKSSIGVDIRGSLASPLIQRTSSSCKLTFAYSKHQSDYLDVSLLMNSREIQIWKSNLINEKTDWNIVSIELGRIQTPFQVLFTGITTFRVFEYQQLSIDYVRFVDCGYESETKGSDLFSCSNGQKIASNRVCDATLDCEKGEDEENCDYQVFSFEHNQLLPWFNAVNEPSSKYEWIVTSGVGTISTKPTLDHTRRLPSGSYAFLYEKNSQHNSKSTNSLMGPELIKTEGCTISFYYYLSSKSPNSSQINVYVSNSDDKFLLKTVHDSSDFGFKRVTIALDSAAIKPPFRVSMEGVSGLNKEYLIAIDDISFNSACYGKSKSEPSTPQPEPEPTPQPDKNCKGDEFYCEADEKCIAIEKTCNYVNDCSDGADEMNCGSCDFNDDLCSWVNEGLNLWLPINRSIAEQEGFPKQTSNPDTFLIATSSPSGGSASIRSPLLGKTSSICLFKFKYHLSDQTKLSVRIRQENSLVSKTVEELLHKGPDSHEWTEGQLELSSLEYNHYIQFVLDSQPSDRFFLSTGLSNFNLLYCDPSKVNFDAFNCDFDTNTCGWTDAGSKDLSWKLITNTSFIDDGTTKFGFGKYSNQEHPSFINLDIYHDHQVNLIRTLTSPWQYATNVFCFSFDYRLLAFAEISLSLVIETPGGIMRSLFMTNSQPNYGWNQGKVTIKNVNEFRLTFKVEMGSNAGDNVISLDNFKLSTESCAFHQASCDFSTGTCDWMNQGWTTVQKQIVESADGQTRNYFLRNTGNKGAKLTLNGFGEVESSKCLSFWYSHTLNVSSELQVDSIKGNKIFSSEIVPSHEMANVWSYYASSVVIKKDYQISIEAKPLGSFDSVYLDDITLYNEPCGYPGNCDFDFDSCGWQNKNQAKWRHNIGVTPSTDNSLADQLDFADRGWFLFVRMNELVHGNLATLESVRLTQTPPVCLTFNYLFTSGQPNEAKITIKAVDVQKDSSSKIDDIVDDGTIKWMNYEKTIRSGYQFKILLIATARANASGDIAIDDIKFTSDKCANDIETTTVQLTTHQTTVTTEDTPHPITVTPSPITRPDDTKSNSTSNQALPYATANALFFLMKQNAHTLVGIMAVACMILLPMVFVVRHLMKPKTSYQPDTNIAMNNKVYDIYSGSGHSSMDDEMYDNIDNALSSSLKFEMRKIAESEGL